MFPLYLILLPTSFFAAQRPPVAHDFKMSVCEMSFPSENEVLQLKFYLFRDDLKQTLYGNPDHPAIDEEKAKAYIQEHFRLSLNDRPATLQFSAMRTKNDQVLIEFRCPGCAYQSPGQLQVFNTLLIEQFRKQVNMVYLMAPGKDRMTLMLHAAKTEGTFSF